MLKASKWHLSAKFNDKMKEKSSKFLQLTAKMLLKRDRMIWNTHI